MKQSQRHKKIFFKIIVIILFYLALSLLYMFPAIKNNNVFGFYDLSFHINRALGLSNVLNSPINFNTFNSNGIQVNLFYPWLTVYPLYLLIKAFSSITIGYNFFMVLLTLCTLLISYLTMKIITGDETKSHFFAVIYSFSAFRSVEIFFRGALGEAIAMTLLPLIFLGIYILFYKNQNNWYVLTLGMTLLIYSHVLSTAMISLFIILFLIFYLWTHKTITKTKILNLTNAAVLTIFLSSSLIFPMIEQTMYQKLNRPYTDILQKRALLFGSQFLNDSFNNDLKSFGIGFPLIVLTFVLLINFKKLSRLSSTALIFGLVSIYFSTKLFPWFLLQNTPLNIIQAPWRFMIFGTFFISFSSSIFLIDYFKILLLNRKKMVVLLALFLLSLNYSSVVSMVNVNTLGLQGVFSNSEIKEKVSSFETYDYVPSGFENFTDNLSNRTVLINDHAVVPTENASDSKIEFTFNNNFKDNATTTLPIYSYKGVTITVNDQPVKALSSPSELVSVKTDRGINTVVIKYKYTNLAKVSHLISIVSLLMFLILFIKFIKTRTKSHY